MSQKTLLTYLRKVKKYIYKFSKKNSEISIFKKKFDIYYPVIFSVCYISKFSIVETLGTISMRKTAKFELCSSKTVGGDTF